MSSDQKESMLSLLDNSLHEDEKDGERSRANDDADMNDTSRSGHDNSGVDVFRDDRDYDTRSEGGSDDERNGKSSQRRSGSGGQQRSREGSADRSRSRSQGEIREERGSSKKRGISPIAWDRKDSEKAPAAAQSEPKRIKSEGELKQEGSAEPQLPADRLDQLAKLRYILRQARFYLIKSCNHDNVDIAKSRSVWSTPPQNEKKLDEAFADCRNVILIFSVRESGYFQGFARVQGAALQDQAPVPWVLPPGLSARALTGVYKLDWICKQQLEFSRAAHLCNAWNENKLVKVGRDGQEIDPKTGEQLCLLFPPDDAVDLKQIALKAKKP